MLITASFYFPNRTLRLCHVVPAASGLNRSTVVVHGAPTARDRPDRYGSVPPDDLRRRSCRSTSRCEEPSRTPSGRWYPGRGLVRPRRCYRRAIVCELSCVLGNVVRLDHIAHAPKSKLLHLSCIASQSSVHPCLSLSDRECAGRCPPDAQSRLPPRALHRALHQDGRPRTSLHRRRLPSCARAVGTARHTLAACILLV